jgi:signal transduction histidine kinase
MMIEDPKLRSFLEKERSAIEKIRRQFQFAKDYEHIGVGSPRWQVIRQLVGRMNDDLDLGDVKITVTTGSASIYADPLFEKVIYNLFDNSLRHGGNVTEIRVSFTEGPGGGVLIVEDNGTGINPLEREKIFERGFGKNTGWGLFLVREILAITGLTIVESGTPGSGARFEIHIPHGKYIAGENGDGVNRGH